MQKTKLIKFLKSLDADEFRRLKKFILSPYFNSNANVPKLYASLRSFYPDFDDVKLTNEFIFKKCFPKEKFDIAKLRRLMSEMTAVLEEYFVVLEVRQKDYDKKKYLSAAYGRRNLYDYFYKGMEELKRTLEAQAYRDGDFYLKMYHLKKTELDHPIKELYQTSQTDFSSLLVYLDEYFCYEKLVLSCELKSRENVLSEKYDIWLLEEIMDRADAIGGEQSSSPIFSKNLKLIQKPSEALYLDLKNIFKENFTKIREKEKKDLLKILINYTVQKINQGNNTFLSENFQLYKMGMEHQLFLEHNQLRHIVYTNIAYIAALAKEYDWCFNFLHTYNHFVDKQFQNDAKFHGLAYLYYKKQTYSKSLDILNQYNYINDFYQFRGRSLLLKILYENIFSDKHYQTWLSSSLESFEKYVRRNETLSKNTKNAYLDFVLILQKLTKFKLSREVADKATKKQFIEMVEKSNRVVSKLWLLEQIDKI